VRKCTTRTGSRGVLSDVAPRGGDTETSGAGSICGLSTGCAGREPGGVEGTLVVVPGSSPVCGRSTGTGRLGSSAGWAPRDGSVGWGLRGRDTGWPDVPELELRGVSEGVEARGEAGVAGGRATGTAWGAGRIVGVDGGSTRRSGAVDEGVEEAGLAGRGAASAGRGAGVGAWAGAADLGSDFGGDFASDFASDFGAGAG